MSQILTAIRAKIYGFAFEDVGASSSNSDVVAVKAKIYVAANVAPLPKARFRPTLDQVPVTPDGGIDLGAIDRACGFAWVDVGDFDAPENPRNVERHRMASFTITNACVRGAGTEKHVVGFTTAEISVDGRAAAVQFADERALSDADELATVLGFDALTQGPNSDEPRIMNVHRTGRSRIVERSNVVIVETPYVVHYRFNVLTAHAP